MSERTAEKEFEVLKGDLLHLLEAIGNAFKKKIDSTREKAVEEIRDDIETHPKTTAIVAGTVAFGLGVLAAKLWYGKSHR